MATTPAAPPADLQKQVKDVESWIRYWRRRLNPQDGFQGNPATAIAQKNQQTQIQKQNIEVLKNLLKNQTQRAPVTFVKNEYNHEKLDPTEIKKRMEFDRSVSLELNNLLDDIRASLFDINNQTEFDTRLNHIKEEKLQHLLDLQQQFTQIKTENELSGPYLKQIAGSIAQINSTLKETQNALIKKQDLGGNPKATNINITLGGGDADFGNITGNAAAGYNLAQASSDSMGLIGAGATAFVFLRHISERLKNLGLDFKKSNRLAAYGSAKTVQGAGRWLGDLADKMQGKFTKMSWAKYKNVFSTIHSRIAKAGKWGGIGLAGLGAAYGLYKSGKYSFENIGEGFEKLTTSKSLFYRLLFLDSNKAVKLGGNFGESLKQSLNLFFLTKGVLFSEEIGAAIKKGWLDKRILKDVVNKYSKFAPKNIFSPRGKDAQFFTRLNAAMRTEKGFFKFLTSDKQTVLEKVFSKFDKNIFDKQNELRKIENKIKGIEVLKNRGKIDAVKASVMIRGHEGTAKRLKDELNVLKDDLKKLEKETKKFSKIREAAGINLQRVQPPKGVISTVTRSCKFIGKAFSKIPWVNGGFLLYDYIRYVRQNPQKKTFEWQRKLIWNPDSLPQKYKVLSAETRQKIVQNMKAVCDWWLYDLIAETTFFGANAISTVGGPLVMVAAGFVTTFTEYLWQKFRDWWLGFKMADCDFDDPLTFINPQELIRKEGFDYAFKNAKLSDESLREVFGENASVMLGTDNSFIDFKTNKVILEKDDFDLWNWGDALKFGWLGGDTNAEMFYSFTVNLITVFMTRQKFGHLYTEFSKGDFLIKMNDQPFSKIFERSLKDYERFTASTFNWIQNQDRITRINNDFSCLKFLISLLEDKEHKILNTLVLGTGVEVGDSIYSSVSIFSQMRIINDLRKGNLIPFKGFDEWLNDTVLIFYIIYYLKENITKEEFKIYEKQIIFVFNYFVKDSEKSLKIIKNLAIKISEELEKNKIFNVNKNDFLQLNIKDQSAFIQQVTNKEKLDISNQFFTSFDALETFSQNLDNYKTNFKAEIEKTPGKFRQAEIFTNTVKQFKNEALFNGGYLPVIMALGAPHLSDEEIREIVSDIIRKLKNAHPNVNGDQQRIAVVNDLLNVDLLAQEVAKFDKGIEVNVKEVQKNYKKLFGDISDFNTKFGQKDGSIQQNSENLNNTVIIKQTEFSAQNQNYSSAPVNFEEVKFGSLDSQVKEKEKESQSEIQNAVFEIPYFTIQTDDGPVNPITNKKSKKLCARGAKTILQKVFKFPYYAGDAYDVPNHSNFKRDFVEIQRPAQFRNGDVYVIDRFKGKQYGHMAVFLNGNWYSDFNQGSLINVYRKIKSDSFIEKRLKFFRPKKFNGISEVKVLNAPAPVPTPTPSKTEFLKNVNVDNVESYNEIFEEKPEKKKEENIIYEVKKTDKQPINTHGATEEQFLIKLEDLVFIC